MRARRNVKFEVAEEQVYDSWTNLEIRKRKKMIDVKIQKGHTLDCIENGMQREWGDDHIHDSEGNLIAQVTNIDEMQMNAQ